MTEKYKPRVLAVIPARGGSKRFPRKNVALLCGKPLICHTIEAAQRSTLITDWLVSSEDDEIIEIATNYGAPVPFRRPIELATDEVRNIDVTIHALEYMERVNKLEYDMIVLLQPTVPIRDPKHIDESIELLWASELDSLASVNIPN